MEGTKNVVKAMNKVGQGKVKEEGKVWFLQLRDKRKRLLQFFFFQRAVVKCAFTTA